MKISSVYSLESAHRERGTSWEGHKQGQQQNKTHSKLSCTACDNGTSESFCRPTCEGQPSRCAPS